MPGSTPENVFVFYSFEAILSGLLAVVLCWAFYTKPHLRQNRPLILLLGALGSLVAALVLCAALNFYEFYYQHPFLHQDPENFAFPFFLLSALLLGVVASGPSFRRSWPLLLVVVGGAVGLLDLLLHLSGWEWDHAPLHWLGVALFFGVLLLVPRPPELSAAFRLHLRLVCFGFFFSFLLFFLSTVSWRHGGAAPLWLGRHLTFLAVLMLLAHLVEIETEDLFIRFFIRLNVIFIVLAGCIIVTVARDQRKEYVDFALRETSELTRSLERQVREAHLRAVGDGAILKDSQIRQTILSHFGRLPTLLSVVVQLSTSQLRMSVDSRGRIERVIEKARSSLGRGDFQPLLEGHRLHLSSALRAGPSGAILGRVDLIESVAEINRKIARQIMAIFTVFSVMVFASGGLIGIIVTQADRTIREQYRELEETHQQLLHAAKLAALGEIAGGVVHEIANPLGVILGRADYLSALAREGPGKDFLEDLEVIERNASRASRIIGDLLDFARVHPLSRSPFDINRILEETVDLIGPRLRERDVKIERFLEPLPEVMVDRDRMQQVLVNLLNNAIDACSPGGTVTLESRYDARQSSIEVCVSDDGMGIAEEDLERVFDPFFTTKEGGTGLGLSVSYRIVHDHGGQMSVTSRQGHGSSFRITLPAGQQGGEA